jgi:hypothetical protein
MSGVFISYRHSDSQDAAGRIFDRLIAHFTPHTVFRDVDSLPLGVPFREYIAQAIGASDAVLVLIGPTWVTCCDSHGRPRLQDANDVVRLEVETALRLSRPTIPITVSNAQMPVSSELPEALQQLPERSGQAVRPDPDFDQDVRRLIQNLAALSSPAGRTPEEPGLPDRPLLERLLQMVQGWHNEVIHTASQLTPMATDREVERITFVYLNTRNFLAQIASMRKVLVDREWARALQSRVDDFLSVVTYRESPADQRCCLPLLDRRHRMGARGLDLSDPRQLVVLDVALHGVVDEIMALLAAPGNVRHEA